MYAVVASSTSAFPDDGVHGWRAGDTATWRHASHEAQRAVLLGTIGQDGGATPCRNGGEAACRKGASAAGRQTAKLPFGRTIWAIENVSDNSPDSPIVLRGR
jgi:hypothetical protein